MCLREGKGQPCVVEKSDMSAGFCNLGMWISNFKWLILKARDPKTKIWKYFVEKCMPFGGSISCAHFQNFSDSIAHLVKFKSKHKKRPLNYLDDFFFTALHKVIINIFLMVCAEINFLVSFDKTF